MNGARGIVALAVRSGLVRGDERVGESLERSGVADAMWARGHASRCDGSFAAAFIHRPTTTKRFGIFGGSRVTDQLGLSRGDPRVNFLSQRVVRHELIDGERLTTERIRLVEQASRDGAPVDECPLGSFTGSRMSVLRIGSVNSSGTSPRSASSASSSTRGRERPR